VVVIVDCWGDVNKTRFGRANQRARAGEMIDQIRSAVALGSICIHARDMLDLESGDIKTI